MNGVAARSEPNGQLEPESFRKRVQAWLQTVLPFPRMPDEALEQYNSRWHRKLYSAGLVGLSFPERYGGAGLSPRYEAILNEELGKAAAPNAPRVGYIAQAILSHGSAEQCAEFIPNLLSGEQIWCQGFSEPGAGSDLAALTTRAQRSSDGSAYLVTGQKLWTSYAQFSSWCLLLARTGPVGGRHRGISAFALDLRTPGIEIRPLRALTGGDDEFCEMFLDTVAIPAKRRIGAEGEGWALAMTTVAFERGAADIGYLPRFARVLDVTRRRIDKLTEPKRESASLRYWTVAAQYEALRAHIFRRLDEREAGEGVGPQMSIDKLLMTRVDQEIHQLALEVSGPSALLGEDDALLHDYLYSRAASIYGGSSQIQRNIIAKSLLGLPEYRERTAIT